MPRPKVTRERLASKACDSCRIRKVRCTEVAPCAACERSGIECTFKKTQAQRGPRGLRPVTIRRIQGQNENTGQPRKEKPSLAEHAGQFHVLTALVDIYASRLFPIWPILDPANLRQALLNKPRHGGTWRLANAVGLATVAQLKLNTAWQPDPDQLRRDSSLAAGTADPLDDLRVSFFLHVYHENSTPGGRESLLYLREAITVAQMMRLEHEGTYASLPESEQHMYRRVLWLLFVTERGVALIHKLPPILKPDLLFPWHTASDETSRVLPSFLKLIQLFWIFDQSGIIDLLQKAESAPTGSLYSPPLVSTCLELLQPTLQQHLTDSDWGSGTDEQRADVFLTRQWMRAILWRAALQFGVADIAVNPVDPVGIAREFLSLTARLPPAALESHGSALEFKTFEIATTVVDAFAGNLCLGFSLDCVCATLFSLRDLLSSFRGGKNKLSPLLEAKMQGILGFGVPGHLLDPVEQQIVTTSLTVEDNRTPEDDPAQGKELLPNFSACVSSQDDASLRWPSSNIPTLLDLPSILTNIRPSPNIVQTAEESIFSTTSGLDYETIDGGGFTQ